MLCDYGCGNTAAHYLKSGRACCSSWPSKCPAIREKNKSGLRKANQEGRKGYTWNPNSAWSKGKTIIPTNHILVEDSRWSNELVKDRIVKESLLDYRCSKCNIDEWQGETIVLDLDHINGNNRDNRLENLRFLCPNCHSQTYNYKGRNKNNGKTKVSDEELLTAYLKGGTIRSTLLDLGLAAKGGNYERLKKLIGPLGGIGRHDRLK